MRAENSLGLTPMRMFRLAVPMLTSLVVLGLPALCSAQIFTVQQNFPSSASVPADVTPVQGRNGHLYGTFSNDQSTSVGGAFQAPPEGGELTTYNLPPSQIDYPWEGLTLATDGNYYGTTGTGSGTYKLGTLFRVSATGVITVLHNFSNLGDGGGPTAAPIEGFDGNLYGTTNGVLNNVTISGSVVYKYTPSGILTTIYEFGSANATTGPVIQAANGNLYGTTPGGGNSGCGTIFEITTAGTLLFTYSFPCGTGGAFPYAPIMQASDGNFYGTTQQDCGYSCGYFGTIYRMTRSGTVATIHTFNEEYGGHYPQGGLVEGTDGYLYGGAGTVLYRITKGGSYSVLESFSSQTFYGFNASLIQHTSGSFYGTTPFGGQYDSGTLFSLDMGLGPFITFVQPTGRVGQAAQILGQGLTRTTSVTFNGVPATSFKVVTDTFMTAVVPSGATTGKQSPRQAARSPAT